MKHAKTYADVSNCQDWGGQDPETTAEVNDCLMKLIQKLNPDLFANIQACNEEYGYGDEVQQGHFTRGSGYGLNRSMKSGGRSGASSRSAAQNSRSAGSARNPSYYDDYDQYDDYKTNRMGQSRSSARRPTAISTNSYRYPTGSTRQSRSGISARPTARYGGSPARSAYSTNSITGARSGMGYRSNMENTDYVSYSNASCSIRQNARYGYNSMRPGRPTRTTSLSSLRPSGAEKPLKGILRPPKSVTIDYENTEEYEIPSRSSRQTPGMISGRSSRRSTGTSSFPTSSSKPRRPTNSSGMPSKPLRPTRPSTGGQNQGDCNVIQSLLGLIQLTDPELAECIEACTDSY